ncbi:MAG TPA: response regulator, partial [Candidatus Competibacteraceae bacterium]|nr:response regulator [Candidatus Competibacteraceae bacterium]
LLLSCLIKEAVKLYRCSFPATVEFRTTLDAETPPVMLDPIQAEQVLMNLCINARDAMEGMGVIDIAVRECQQVAGVCASCRQQVAGSFVEMAVRDTGPGIAPAVLERMFEPFFTTKEVGRGSGMGLATAHGIVHEYGGHILVESAPEQGALFRVLFPATQAAVPADAADAEPRAMERGYSGRVLVVDDEASVRAFMEELLQSRGFQVRSAGDGQIALELLCCEKEPPDLVITDQTMPRLTGLALARELRVRWPLLPVILYTGHGEKLAADELREAGVATVLHKPLDVGELFAAIRELLAARAR